MSEFNFTCPICGKNIQYDAAHRGTQHICPHCNNLIGLPATFAEQSDDSTDADIPPALPESIPTFTQRTSGLAVASLVCSLLSLITCVGWLPGIICGHLAKSRIRRNPVLKGGGLATAGLVIGYLILMLEAGSAAVWAWHFSAAVKRGYESVRQDLATNQVTIIRTQSTTVSNVNRSMASIVTNDSQIYSDNSEWTLDFNQAAFPDHLAGGKLHGNDFIVKSASFRGGNLKINSANGTSVEILHGLGASIESRSYQILSTDDSSTNPHVKMTWTEDGVIQSQTFNKGYLLKLQIGQAKSRTASAKIYLCFPDDLKSCIAGSFEVKIIKPKK